MVRQAPHNAASERHRDKQRKETFLGMQTTFLGSNIPILHTIGGRAYPVRHNPLAIRLRTRNSTPHQFTKLVGDPVGCDILGIALNPQSGDFSGAILGVRSVALLHGEIRQGIREVKEIAI